MSTGYTIHVSGLAPETTEAKLHDFFSFCGKLTSVKKFGTEADITFEKQSAMRTSLMLNGGTLDGAHLEVTTQAPAEDKAVLPTAESSAPVEHHIEQEDKPKAAIAAEYLANGYLLGDHIIQKAIDVDSKQGISKRFLSFLDNIDKKAGERFVGENKTVSSKALEHANTFASRAREADQQRGVSTKFHSYYSKALSTPLGQQVAKFYQDTSKQVLDVHEEAKRIAKKSASQAPTPPNEPVDAAAPAAAAAAPSAVPVSAPVNAEVEAKEAAQAAAAAAAAPEKSS
ncbi:uncharacterized protein EHS24_006293 [Apiotrichum porosum]|uniref:RRM domain-containing protein n=1 Tax=Apiotrichum porosum TaxID=105984 RepID=A0A427Y0W8_9TREE|nr:uncharacterized protein EHS24_006293 [Apiotrichum porosum]RSH84768.1 hypothetical protein EHS24_006293 [Apiotrichum porosum]